MIYQKLAKIALLPLFLSAAGCSPDGAESDLANGSGAVASALGPKPITALGQGVNAMSGEGKGECLTFENEGEDLLGPSAPELKHIPSANALMKILNISATELKKTAANSLKAQLVSDISFEPRLMHVLYSVKRLKEAGSTTNARIQGIGTGANAAGLAAFYKSDYPGFLRSCGDSYVSHMERGDAFYALITIVADGVDSSKALVTDLVASGADPSKLSETLKKYPVESVRTLYHGQSSSTEWIELNQLESKIREITSMSKPVENELIGMTLTKYSDIAPSPDARQAQRLAYVSAFNNLAAEQLKADQCSDRLKAISGNPVEYAPSDLSLINSSKAVVDQYVKANGTALDICEADLCSDQVCAIDQCSIETAEDEIPAGLSAAQQAIETCKAGLPALQTTNAQLYLTWKKKNGINGELGAMQGVSSMQGGMIHQQFANAGLFKLSYHHLIGQLPRKVYDKWMASPEYGSPATYGAPAQVNGAHVYTFAEGGNLYDVEPQNPAGPVYKIGAFDAYNWLGSELPAGDAVSIPNPTNQPDGFLDFRAELKVQSGAVLVAGYKRAAGDINSAPRYSRVRLSLDSPLYSYYQTQGGLAGWGVPLEGENDGGGNTRYIVGPDESGIWATNYGVFTLPAGVHRKYLNAGGGASSYGHIYESYNCASGSCRALTEGGELIADVITGPFIPHFPINPHLLDMLRRQP